MKSPISIMKDEIINSSRVHSNKNKGFKVYADS